MNICQLLAVPAFIGSVMMNFIVNSNVRAVYVLTCTIPLELYVLLKGFEEPSDMIPTCHAYVESEWRLCCYYNIPRSMFDRLGLS